MFLVIKLCVDDMAFLEKYVLKIDKICIWQILSKYDFGKMLFYLPVVKSLSQTSHPEFISYHISHETRTWFQVVPVTTFRFHASQSNSE